MVHGACVVMSMTLCSCLSKLIQKFTINLLKNKARKRRALCCLEPYLISDCRLMEIGVFDSGVPVVICACLTVLCRQTPKVKVTVKGVV